MMPYLKPKNRQKQTALIFLVLFFVSVILIFIPNIIGMDGMNGGFAISFVSFFLAISFMVSFIVFFVLAKKFNDVIAGDNLILHWIYEKSEWLKFSQKEYKVQKKEKFYLFILIISISFIVLLIFSIAVRDSWRIMIIVFFGLTALLGFTAFIVPKIQYLNFKKNLPEVYLSSGSVYITGEFHCWRIMGASLDEVEMDDTNMQIKITYSYPTRYNRSRTTLRIPLPNHKSAKAEAVEAISLLKKNNNL